MLGIFLILDGYFGLIHSSSMLIWIDIFTGQIKWLALSIEIASGGIMLVRVLVNHASLKWKNPIIVSAPILVILIGFCTLHLTLSGLDRSSTINFNLTSIGLSGLYWSGR